MDDALRDLLYGLLGTTPGMVLSWLVFLRTTREVKRQAQADIIKRQRETVTEDATAARTYADAAKNLTETLRAELDRLRSEMQQRVQDCETAVRSKENIIDQMEREIENAKQEIEALKKALKQEQHARMVLERYTKALCRQVTSLGGVPVTPVVVTPAGVSVPPPEK